MSAPHWLRIQLSGPKGLLARPMAHLLNRMNKNDYSRALQRLQAQSSDRVLELGFGGGLGVAALLEVGAYVIAAEPSEDLRERGYRLWSRPLAQGKMELWPHCAEDLPDLAIDRALSMNTLYFWKDVEGGFANLRRMVKSRVVFGIASVEHLNSVGFASEGFRIEEPSWYEEKLAEAGFATFVVPAPDKGSCSLLVGDVSS